MALMRAGGGLRALLYALRMAREAHCAARACPPLRAMSRQSGDGFPLVEFSAHLLTPPFRPSIAAARDNSADGFFIQASCDGRPWAFGCGMFPIRQDMVTWQGVRGEIRGVTCHHRSMPKTGISGGYTPHPR